jgi:hypothetical protein
MRFAQKANPQTIKKTIKTVLLKERDYEESFCFDCSCSR